MRRDARGQLLLFGEVGLCSAAEPTGRLFSWRPEREGVGLRMCVLGSGSSGNCTVVQRGGSVMLIDAGFGPRATARRLGGTGIGLEDIGSVCLTHLDRDHFDPAWVGTFVQRRVRVHVLRRHVGELERIGAAGPLWRAGLLEEVEERPFEPIAGVCALPVVLPHDEKGTAGFVLRAEEGSIGYATDLGHVPEWLIEHFAGVSVLAIECNYDPELQRGSARPRFLKRRVMGGAGHLSNQQAFEAVRRIAACSVPRGPDHIVLLHRSRQCNHPDLVRGLFERDGDIARRLVLAEQSRRTGWLAVVPTGVAGRQRALVSG